MIDSISSSTGSVASAAMMPGWAPNVCRYALAHGTIASCQLSESKPWSPTRVVSCPRMPAMSSFLPAK
ncbi:hypothetical protein [Leucobacter komagatae]|uniref:hypothetical protein n=1 Tax=Leucobacter komagatae TaxID=55969 RepID=UPI0006963C60|nr:hypothetical protein [Leucobacter komagatae]